ncbi:MAG: hypothetical protein HY899_14045 [Deltaproteobacteria bacterium]|nr:hypothetical protein [Deltaproteobacteria bacterium]
MAGSDPSVTAARRCASLVVAGLWLAAATPVAALLGDVEGSGGLDANLRTTVLGIDNYHAPALLGDHDFDMASQTLLRAVIAGRPSDSLRYEVHAVQSLEQSTATGGAAAGLASPVGPSSSNRELRYRALDFTWAQDDRGQWRSGLVLDRANATLRLGAFDVTAGRQAITFGHTFFWSPLDVFSPFDAQQFDRDYKPGVDALRVDGDLGALSGVTLVASAGRSIDAAGQAAHGGFADASWTGSALLARAFTNVAGWDLEIQAGKVYAGWQVGLGATGEWLGVDLRVEMAALRADSSPPLVIDLPAPMPDLVRDAETLVVGAGRRFDNSLDLHAEYFLNGSGDADDLATSLARVSGGALLAASRHLIGVTAAYELLPILVARLSWIVSLEDGSGQVQPGLTWSAADNVEVLLGAFVSHGQRPDTPDSGSVDFRSEFGSYPSVLYLQPKIYF